MLKKTPHPRKSEALLSHPSALGARPASERCSGDSVPAGLLATCPEGAVRDTRRNKTGLCTQELIVDWGNEMFFREL